MGTDLSFLAFCRRRRASTSDGVSPGASGSSESYPPAGLVDAGGAAADADAGGGGGGGGGPPPPLLFAPCAADLSLRLLMGTDLSFLAFCRRRRASTSDGESPGMSGSSSGSYPSDELDAGGAERFGTAAVGGGGGGGGPPARESPPRCSPSSSSPLSSSSSSSSSSHHVPGLADAEAGGAGESSSPSSASQKSAS